jgi:hypothetical protein
MGNKSSSTLVTINEELCNRKKNKSQRTDKDGEAVILLDNILECVGSYSAESVKLNSKDIKLLSSIASHLSEEFGGVVLITCEESEMSARLRAVTVMNRILQISFVAKNALENCAPGLTNCISSSHAQLTCLALNCVFTGLVSLNDDVCKCTILLQLETLGFYKMMLEVFDSITKCSYNERPNQKLSSFAFLMCVQHLVWILGQQSPQSGPQALSSTLKAFQKRLADEIFKHQDIIFVLTRDKEKPVRFAATILLIKLLSIQDRRQCAYLQVLLACEFLYNSNDYMQT